MRAIDASKLKRPEQIDPGPAPMMQWLRIDALVVDDSYQRDLKPGNWKAIRSIAAQFRWSRFSPVFVAPIEGGKFAIIDGQHRTHAAALCGFAEVPCQIVQMSREEQAASFAAVNGLVTRVTNWQIFKAALAAGEDWAHGAAAVATEAGCRLMTSNTSHFLKKPGEIFGVTKFRQIVEARPRPAIVAALKLLMQADGFRDEPAAWDMGVLGPLLLALASRPKALERPDFRAAFELFDLWGLCDRIVADNRDRIRKGLPYVPKRDQLESRLVDWIDSKFPEAVSALPGKGRKAK